MPKAISIDSAGKLSELEVSTGQIIVTSGTSFTTPANITTSTVFYIELVGGGGSGGGGVSSGSGSGGGSGGYCYKAIIGLTPSTTYACVIGVGGTTNAGTSTTLTIGVVTYTAGGGGTGITSASIFAGVGGAATNGDINISGQTGDAVGLASNSGVGAGGGNSPKGWGMGGRGAQTGGNGLNATGYGGGGGAGRGVGNSGGIGGNGIIFCEWFNQIK